ncbi:MAG: YtxH domain-containing protein [Anaerolineae bacterium]|nr:YtxH domain-containing protein [Anaerolineae bacterium]MCA9890684.1 YtxH domain-containing protein [Anaerolineae bacterium]MCB9458516.1 YtxH domain-containing protein [Anaerolineaceae bacterium]
MSERIYYSQDAKMQAQRQTFLVVVFMLSIGVGIGAVLGLLFAPKTGEVTREELAKAVEERAKEVESQMSDLRKKIDDRISA